MAKKRFSVPKSEAEFIERCNAFRLQSQKCNGLLAIRDALALLTEAGFQWPLNDYFVRSAKKLLPKNIHYVLLKDGPEAAKSEELRASTRNDDAWDQLNDMDDIYVLASYAPQTDAGKIAGLSMLCEVIGKDGDPGDNYEVHALHMARAWISPAQPKAKRSRPTPALVSAAA